MPIMEQDLGLRNANLGLGYSVMSENSMLLRVTFDQGHAMFGQKQ